LLWLSKGLRWQTSSWHNDRSATLVKNRLLATNHDRGKRARSEATSSANGNCRLADNDARWWITQNSNLREYDHDRKDLRNFIDDRRYRRARSSTPPRCSPTRDVTPSGRGNFRALAPSLTQVVWPEMFKAEHIDKFEGSNNPEKFILVNHTVIEAAGGDDQVKANYLPTALACTTRSCLISLPEGSIYT
jgi:hypothetical protein